MKDLIIVGAGGLGREIEWLVGDINQNRPTWNFVGFLDDDIENCNVSNFKKLGKIEEYKNFPTASFVFGIGNVDVKKKIFEHFFETRNLATLIHPKAIIAKDAVIGAGVVICSNCVISINTRISDNVLLNWGVTVGHDSVIDSFVSVMPGVNISGNVNIGQNTFIGTGAKVVNNINVGQGCTIGAGSVVINSVLNGQTVFGNPARFFLKK